MLTGAMQTMLENMLREAVQNLPPELQKKIGTALGFLASVDARMAKIEADLQFLRAQLEQQKVLTNGRTVGNQHSERTDAAAPEHSV